MARRKDIVKTRSELANVLAKLEKGKTEAKVGDIRQVLKWLVSVEAAGYLIRRKSILIMLRKDAIALAKKKSKK